MIIHDDFEYVLILSTNNINFVPNTKKYQRDQVWCYGCKLLCVDERYSKPQKTYFAEDLIVKFLNDMVKENEYCIK